MNRPKWVEFLGIGYVLLALLVILNVVTSGWGPPALGADSWVDQQGSTGLALTAWIGLGVSLVAARWGQLVDRQWQLAGVVGLWCGMPAISMVLHGSLEDGRYWSVALASASLAVSAALISADSLRTLIYGLGWFYGWGSVVSGLADAFFGWPKVLVGGDDRYGRWLSVLGLNVGEVPSLNGLLGGRIFVGMTSAVLLAFVVRIMLGRTTSRWLWLMPLGLLGAVGWSFARVGATATAVGLVAAIIPWERLRKPWLASVLLVVALVPILVGQQVVSEWLPDGTTRWRVDLWHRYLSDPSVLGPFGIGPQVPSDWVTGHAHNQFLESQATGGWLAVTGLTAFLMLGAAVARASALADNRAAIAVLFVAAAIFQVDILTFAPTFASLNSAFVLVVVVIASSAGKSVPSSDGRHQSTAAVR